jgi:uncharacterized protein (DUF302 family)
MELMMADTYTLHVTLPTVLDDADGQVRAALKEEGFGVLTEIDVEATLREKLGVEVGGYRILGACNPQLAHRGLTADPDLGALLPCNVVLRAAGDDRTDVLAADPVAMLGISSAEGLTDVATEARDALERALSRLA